MTTVSPLSGSLLHNQFPVKMSFPRQNQKIQNMKYCKLLLLWEQTNIKMCICWDSLSKYWNSLHVFHISTKIFNFPPEKEPQVHIITKCFHTCVNIDFTFEWVTKRRVILLIYNFRLFWRQFGWSSQVSQTIYLTCKN